MRLMLETGEVPADEVPAEIAEIELTPEEKAMSPEELKNTAQTMVFDNNYMHYKDRIRENVRLCTQSLIRSSSQELEQASAQLSHVGTGRFGADMEVQLENHGPVTIWLDTDMWKKKSD